MCLNSRSSGQLDGDDPLRHFADWNADEFLARGYVDGGYRIGSRVGNVAAPPVGREGKPVGSTAYGDGSQLMQAGKREDGYGIIQHARDPHRFAVGWNADSMRARARH